VIGISEDLRRLPAVGALLLRSEIIALLEQLPREMVLEALHQAVGEARSALQDKVARDASGPPDGRPQPAETTPPPPSRGILDDEELLAKWIVARAVALAGRAGLRSLRRVVNATGVVLHTNLGRAVMSAEAVAAVAEAASHYTNLEYDLPEGRRGSRQDHLSELIRLLSGAEDGLAVNNNAGAVLLMLNTLAEGREVIVSRGELVEIGGSFRIPDIMRKSGAHLVEVGTTNRTHPDDYRRAIGPRTGLLLKVHTSNYRIVGFTAEVPAAELVSIGAERGIPVLYDLGSGAVYDYALAGMPGEPTLKEAVATGAAAVTASGDKLLGGPQAGIITGKKDLLSMARRNPLARALRLDKLTIAGLQATLEAYLKPSPDGRAVRDIPVVEMITRSPGDVHAEAVSLAGLLRASAAGDGVSVEVIEGKSEVGGGAFPASAVGTWLVAMSCRGVKTAELLRRLREAPVPVIARVQEGRVVLDPRTLLPGDDQRVAEAVSLVAAAASARAGAGPADGPRQGGDRGVQQEAFSEDDDFEHQGGLRV